MTSQESLFVDVDSFHQRKQSEHVCGDAFMSKRLEEEGRLVAVLSDGLGSGIKANILASMTACMAVRFTCAEQDILHSAEVIMDSLPVCQIRQISYATFSIADCHADGQVKIIEEGNPPFLLIRKNQVLELEKRLLASTKWPDRKLLITDFRLEPGDRLIFCSDGVTQAGLGHSPWKLGWRQKGLVDYVLSQISLQSNISSRQLTRNVVMEAVRKEPESVAKDDTSCAVLYFRHPRKLLIWTGPPYEKERDREYALKFDRFSGKKVLSGGTTANIAARELNRPITMRLASQRGNVPMGAEMPGVDLVTEGVLTLAKTAEYLEDSQLPSVINAATALAELLLDSDNIEFMVGSRINEAHLDPSLPIDLDFRKNIIRRLEKILRERYLKNVAVLYI